MIRARFSAVFVILFIVLSCYPLKASRKSPSVACGVYQTIITKEFGGIFSPLVEVNRFYPDSFDILLFIEGKKIPTNINDLGRDWDLLANDGFFSFAISVDPIIDAEQILPQFLVVNQKGEQWLLPYLEVLSDYNTSLPQINTQGFSQLDILVQDMNFPFQDFISAINESDCIDNLCHLTQPPISIIFMEKYTEAFKGKPQIISAGYGCTEITTRNGGLLHFSSAVFDPYGNDDVKEIILFYGNKKLLNLNDEGLNGDFEKGDGIWSGAVRVKPGLPAGRYLLTAVAKDKSNIESDPWPWIKIHCRTGLILPNSSFTNHQAPIIGLLKSEKDRGEFIWKLLRFLILLLAGIFIIYQYLKRNYSGLLN